MSNKKFSFLNKPILTEAAERNFGANKGGVNEHSWIREREDYKTTVQFSSVPFIRIADAQEPASERTLSATVDVNDSGRVVLSFIEAGNELVKRITIKDERFYAAAQTYREAVQNNMLLGSSDEGPKYAQARREAHAAGTKIFMEILRNNGVEFADDITEQHKPTRALFFLCAHVVPHPT